MDYLKKISGVILLLTGILLMGEQDVLYAQTRYVLSGYVSDSASGEMLSGASVRVDQANVGAVTNTYGYYTLQLPEGNYNVRISYLGYKDKLVHIDLSHSRHINIRLAEGTFHQKEVVITDRQEDENVSSTAVGKVHLPMKRIEKLPALFGEIDVLKALQLLPGVRSGGEGTSGLFIRGGGPGQNLVLLDGAPVYNTGHLFGFFSVFNGDAVKDVTLIKGGMPANYGGRLSSVVDISMKEGNNKEIHGKGGIGLIASRFSLEGPVIKNKASFFVSARRTYIDALVKPFVPKNSSFHGSGYYFYDLNAKVNYIFSDKDRLFLSGYLGRDRFKFVSSDQNFKTTIPWGNETATLRWNHLFSNRLFVNTELIYNAYNFAFNGEQQDLLIGMHSGIKDHTFKTSFSYFLNNDHHIKWGGNYTFHKFIPSTVSGKSNETSFDAANPFKKYAREASLYLLDDWQITKRLQINAGVRWSLFQQVGPYTSYTRDAEGTVTDSTVYGKSAKVQSYAGWEPRLIVQYALKHNNSIKASITRNFQYIHLVSSNTTTLPTDLWIPSTSVVRPEKAWQYSLGYYQNFQNNTYETSLAFYFKNMDNQIEFGAGYVPSLEDPQNSLVFGASQAYGAELFIHKQKGRLKGWLGYTLSWVWRQFPDLNEGERYPSRQDRRHNIKIVASYHLNDRWTLAGDFIFQTGNPTTLPEKFYFIEGVLSQAYAHLNTYRLRPYHRLDLSATYTPKPKPGRAFSHSWTFSIYNAYSRLNPYFIYFDTNGAYLQKSLTIQPKKVALFPVIPSVTWNFEF